MIELDKSAFVWVSHAEGVCNCCRRKVSESIGVAFSSEEVDRIL